MATLSTFIGLPVGIPLGGVSLAGASISGVTTVLTKKYQKKLLKVTKLTDIVISALAVFEMSVSKALKDNKVDEREFNLLQELHIKSLNKLSNIDRKMEAENRTQVQKSFLEQMNDMKESLLEKIDNIRKKKKEFNRI